jgi:hypothetical protein
MKFNMADEKVQNEHSAVPRLWRALSPRTGNAERDDSLSHTADRQPATSADITKIGAFFFFAIIAAVGVFYIATIRTGHEWGDDFSMYIMHAQNLADGRKYGETGYIYNPNVYLAGSDMVLIGPQSYPPLFPLLLSPVYKIWGANLNAMKIVIIVTFLLALTAVYLAFKDILPSHYLITLVALIGFNPYFWSFKDNIVSDLPFLLFVYLSLVAIDRHYSGERSLKSKNLDALLIGISIYLSYGTRSPGLVLLPTLVVYDVIKNRKLTLFVLKVVVITGILVLLQNIFVHSDSGYAGHIGFSLTAGIRHLIDYTKELSAVMTAGSPKVIRYLLFFVLLGLAAIGLRTKCRENLSAFEVFLVLYSLPWIVLPLSIDIRFFIPILPLLLLYVFIGAAAISKRGKYQNSIAFAVPLFILATYTFRYLQMDYGPIRKGIDDAEAVNLFNYVKENTGQDDVIIFRKPRALTLFTGKRTSSWHYAGSDDELWKYFQTINATYLILGPHQVESADQEKFSEFISRNKDQLDEVYRNTDFNVYRIRIGARRIDSEFR